MPALGKAQLCAVPSSPATMGLRHSVPQKRKSPEQGRGALFYANKSTRLVIAMSSQKYIICNMLKRRTLACIKKPAPMLQTTQTS